jgi:hypothetical protein
MQRACRRACWARRTSEFVGVQRPSRALMPRSLVTPAGVYCGAATPGLRRRQVEGCGGTLPSCPLPTLLAPPTLYAPPPYPHRSKIAQPVFKDVKHYGPKESAAPASQ